MTKLSVYPIGTKVKFTLCEDAEGFIIGITIGRNDVVTYDVSYWTNEPKIGHFREFELTKFSDKKREIGFK